MVPQGPQHLASCLVIMGRRLVLERIGRKVSNRFAGGVLMVEVTKQVPAPPRRGLPEALRRPLRALDGIASPEPKPV